MPDIKKEAAWKDYNYETLGAIAGGLGVPLFDRYVLGNKRGLAATLGEAAAGAALGYGGGNLLRQGVSTSGQMEKLKKDVENSPKKMTTQRVVHGLGGGAVGWVGGDLVGKRLANMYFPAVDAPTRGQVITDYQIAARTAKLNNTPENMSKMYDAAARYKQYTGEMPPGVVSAADTEIATNKKNLAQLHRERNSLLKPAKATLTLDQVSKLTPEQQLEYIKRSQRSDIDSKRLAELDKAVTESRAKIAQLKQQQDAANKAVYGFENTQKPKSNPRFPRAAKATQKVVDALNTAEGKINKVTGGVKGSPNLRRTAVIQLARGAGALLGGGIGYAAPDWLYDSPDNMAEQIMGVAESVKNLPPPQRDAAMSEFLDKAGRGYTPEMKKTLENSVWQ